MNRNLISIGNYKENYVFYDKSSGKLLYCESKQNIGFKESFVAGAGLLALPIVRWLNSYFINKSILNNCLILFLAVWIAYFLAKVIFERIYSEICVSDFRISDSEYANFLEAAKKNDLWADGYDKSVGISDEGNEYPFAGYNIGCYCEP